jgi:hypothetical protein
MLRDDVASPSDRICGTDVSGPETEADQYTPGRLIAQDAAGLQPIEPRNRESVIHHRFCSLSSKALAPRGLREPVPEFALLVPYDSNH